MAVPSVEADKTGAPKTEAAVLDLIRVLSCVLRVLNLDAETEEVKGLETKVVGSCVRMLNSTTTEPVYTATVLIVEA